MENEWRSALTYPAGSACFARRVSANCQISYAMGYRASGKLDMKRFISHRFDLDHIAEAFAVAEGHTGMRVVVKPQGLA